MYSVRGTACFLFLTMGEKRLKPTVLSFMFMCLPPYEARPMEGHTTMPSYVACFRIRPLTVTDILGI